MTTAGDHFGMDLGRLLARTLGWLAIGSLCAGCGDDADGSSAPGLDLVASSPDEWTDQPGLLLPEDDDGFETLGPWGPAGPMGWANDLRVRPHGDHALTNGSFAHLDLQTASARDREIELSAWLWEEAPRERCPIRISLNGVVAHRDELTKEPKTLSFAAPAAMWVEGSNVLRLELEPEDDEAATDGLRLAVARVRYDEPGQVTRHPSSIDLAPSTSVAWNVTPRAGATFTLRGKADGPGRLRIELRPIDVIAGELGPVEFDSEIDAERGALERGLRLEASATPVQVRVTWEDARKRFRIDEARLIEEAELAAPHVIFLAVDTLAARNLSLYGYERETSPHLDALADDAVVFERCITNAPWTLPSFLSVMTGTYAYSHHQDPAASGSSGADVDVWEMWFLTDNRWTLAEDLRARGFDTAGFVDNHWLAPKFGFTQGFSTYDWSAGRIDKLDNDGGIRHVTRLARRWLSDRRRDDPFFLFLHCFDAHGPYSPEGDHRGAFRTDGRPLSPGEAWADGVHNVYGVVPTYITTGEFPEDETPARVSTSLLHASYDEGIRMTDESIGRFLDHLRETGVYDESVIVVFSDHGETMGDEAYLFGHGTLDDAVLHVPLIVKLPGQRHAGKRVAEAVQLVDLYPTVLELVGAETTGKDLHGRSLVPLIEERDESTPTLPILSEGGICEQRAVEIDGWKLVESRPGHFSADQVVLTHPLTRRVLRGEERESVLASGVRPERLQEFREDPAVQELFGRLEGKGLTQDLLRELRAAPEYGRVLALTRRILKGPFYALYDLENDPGETTDVRADHPQRFESLRTALASALEARDASQERGRFPTEPVQLSAEDLSVLGDLGYADFDDGD